MGLAAGGTFPQGESGCWDPGPFAGGADTVTSGSRKKESRRRCRHIVGLRGGCPSRHPSLGPASCRGGWGPAPAAQSWRRPATRRLSSREAQGRLQSAASARPVCPSVRSWHSPSGERSGRGACGGSPCHPATSQDSTPALLGARTKLAGWAGWPRGNGQGLWWSFRLGDRTEPLGHPACRQCRHQLFPGEGAPSPRPDALIWEGPSASGAAPCPAGWARSIADPLCAPRMVGPPPRPAVGPPQLPRGVLLPVPPPPAQVMRTHGQIGPAARALHARPLPAPPTAKERSRFLHPAPPP